MSRYHLYLHTPQPVFKAKVNLPGAITYPVTSLPYDSVTLGAYGDIQPYMTLLLGTTEGADDLGRVRVKYLADATSISLPRTARGIEDGTLDIRDGAFITVLNDWRIWAKIPYFDLGEEENPGNDYKDGDIPAGTYLTDIPPVANTGPAMAGYVDPDSGLLTVTLPGGGSDLSFAMADGATIATYIWDVRDGTITVGTANDPVITATFPPGFRWVALSIVDSNDQPHTAWCPVLAIDPEDDPTLREFSATQRLEVGGQSLDIQLYKPLDRADYPDGTLVLLWWDEPVSSSDRSHMKFVGWLGQEAYGVERKREGLVRTTTLHALDVAGRLKLLPGFPQALERSQSDSLWSWMPSLDINKSLHYLLFWHSTALDVVDFFLPSDGGTYDAMRLDASGATLFNQVDSQAQKMVPDHYLACNSQGQLRVVRDWMLDDPDDRPAVSLTLDESQWTNLSLDYNRHPRVHSLRSGAILSSTDWVVVDGEDTLPLAFSIAPGEAAAFSQGTIEATENEGLALTQEGLNICEGHRYALLNSRYGEFSFSDPTGSAFWGYEPALLSRVQLTIGTGYQAYRDLQSTQLIGRVQTVTVSYKTGKTGTQLTVSATLKKEESGAPALTFDPETGTVTKVPYTPPPVTWTPPDYNDPNVYFGDIQGYLLWDAVNVYRTWDLQAVSPTWEVVTGDLTGNITDIQYAMTDDATVGAWALTVDGVWWCADILADAPLTWTKTLSKETMQAADGTPPGASNFEEFKGMATWGSDPGFCIVTTGPNGTTLTAGVGWLHSYYWHTDDYGANWTQVDHTADFYHTSSYGDNGYAYSGPFGIAMYRDLAGTLYCLRQTVRYGISGGRTGVFRSTDRGHTWTLGASWAYASEFIPGGSLLHPYPDEDDSCYVVFGTDYAEPSLRFSNDGWLTWTPLTNPTGYDYCSGVWRPNKRTFDDTHCILWWHNIADNHMHLLESFDRGASWSLLWDSGLVAGPYTMSAWSEPNGWPPDVAQWVIVHNVSKDLEGGDIVIYLTLDNFATLLDKTGNLSSIIADWVTDVTHNGYVGGFALPRVGANA